MSTANTSVVRSFDWISRVYDNPLVQRFGYRANHDAVISALRGHGANRVVDVGCGTGILASRIARELRPEVVYGCDPSAGMLEKARGRAREGVNASSFGPGFAPLLSTRRTLRSPGSHHSRTSGPARRGFPSPSSNREATS